VLFLSQVEYFDAMVAYSKECDKVIFRGPWEYSFGKNGIGC